MSCWTETLEQDRSAYRGAHRVDFREAALRARAGQLLAQGVLSVSADTTVEALEAKLAARASRAASVVDEEGKLIGIVRTRTFFVGMSQAARLRTRPWATSCPRSFTRSLKAPPSHTRSVSLRAKIPREVPIVSDDGRLVGLLTSTDLLRWVARDLGYVL